METEREANEERRRGVEQPPYSHANSSSAKESAAPITADAAAKQTRPLHQHDDDNNNNNSSSSNDDDDRMDVEEDESSSDQQAEGKQGDDAQGSDNTVSSLSGESRNKAAVDNSDYFESQKTIVRFRTKRPAPKSSTPTSTDDSHHHNSSNNNNKVGNGGSDGENTVSTLSGDQQQQQQQQQPKPTGPPKKKSRMIQARQNSSSSSSRSQNERVESSSSSSPDQDGEIATRKSEDGAVAVTEESYNSGSGSRERGADSSDSDQPQDQPTAEAASPTNITTNGNATTTNNANLTSDTSNNTTNSTKMIATTAKHSTTTAVSPAPADAKTSSRKKLKKPPPIPGEEIVVADANASLTTPAGQLAANPHYTQQQALDESKREYNRRNASRARQRAKSKVDNLQGQAKALTNDVQRLKDANAKLQRDLQSLKIRNLEIIKMQKLSSDGASLSSSVPPQQQAAFVGMDHSDSTTSRNGVVAPPFPGADMTKPCPNKLTAANLRIASLTQDHTTQEQSVMHQLRAAMAHWEKPSASVEHNKPSPVVRLDTDPIRRPPTTSRRQQRSHQSVVAVAPKNDLTRLSHANARPEVAAPATSSIAATNNPVRAALLEQLESMLRAKQGSTTNNTVAPGTSMPQQPPSSTSSSSNNSSSNIESTIQKIRSALAQRPKEPALRNSSKSNNSSGGNNNDYTRDAALRMVLDQQKQQVQNGEAAASALRANIAKLQKEQSNMEQLQAAISSDRSSQPGTTAVNNNNNNVSQQQQQPSAGAMSNLKTALLQLKQRMDATGTAGKEQGAAATSVGGVYDHLLNAMGGNQSSASNRTAPLTSSFASAQPPTGDPATMELLRSLIATQQDQGNNKQGSATHNNNNVFSPVAKQSEYRHTRNGSSGSQNVLYGQSNPALGNGQSQFVGRVDTNQHHQSDLARLLAMVASGNQATDQKQENPQPSSKTNGTLPTSTSLGTSSQQAQPSASHQQLSMLLNMAAERSRSNSRSTTNERLHNSAPPPPASRSTATSPFRPGMVTAAAAQQQQRTMHTGGAVSHASVAGANDGWGSQEQQQVCDDNASSSTTRNNNNNNADASQNAMLSALANMLQQRQRNNNNAR